MCEPDVTPPLPYPYIQNVKLDVLDLHVSLLFDDVAIIARFVPRASCPLPFVLGALFSVLRFCGISRPSCFKITQAISTQAISTPLVRHTSQAGILFSQ